MSATYHITKQAIPGEGLTIAVPDNTAINLMADGTGAIFAVMAERILSEEEKAQQAAQQSIIERLLAGGAGGGEAADFDDSFSFEDDDDE